MPESQALQDFINTQTKIGALSLLLKWELI